MAETGFPANSLYTPVPNMVFGSLLEAITDIAELKCTLRVLWLLHNRKNGPRYLTASEIAADPVLCRSFPSSKGPTQEAILRGLQMAVERGTLLKNRIGEGQDWEDVYVLDDAPGRRALENLQQDASKKGTHRKTRPAPPEEATPRPNIFTLYEENIGLLTPILAERLKEAEMLYPALWLEEAFEQACAHNKRSWRYIEAILKRWRDEGRDDGKLGGYTKKISLREYERRRGPSSPRY